MSFYADVVHRPVPLDGSGSGSALVETLIHFQNLVAEFTYPQWHST